MEVGTRWAMETLRYRRKAAISSMRGLVTLDILRFLLFLYHICYQAIPECKSMLTVNKRIRTSLPRCWPSKRSNVLGFQSTWDVDACSMLELSIIEMKCCGITIYGPLEGDIRKYAKGFGYFASIRCKVEDLITTMMIASQLKPLMVEQNLTLERIRLFNNQRGHTNNVNSEWKTVQKNVTMDICRNVLMTMICRSIRRVYENEGRCSEPIMCGWIVLFQGDV